MRRWALRVLGGLALLVALAALLPVVLGTRERPAPDRVPGHRTMVMTPPHRGEPVRLDVWYPATAGATRLLGQNALFYGHHVRPDAPAAEGAHPVVALSHGSGGNAAALGWLAGRIAAAGFVVVAPNHPGTMSRDSDPHRTPLVWERTGDVTAALDAVAGSDLGADLARVAAVGFSLGGHTALAAAGVRVSKPAFIAYCERFPDRIDCGWMNAAGVDFAAIDARRYEADLRDGRIDAVAAIDGALPLAMTEESLRALETPALLVNLGVPEDVPNGMRLDGVAARMPQATYLAVPGAHHFHALAECSLLGKLVIALAGDDAICSDAGGRDRGTVHAELASAVTSFLLESLGPV